MGACLPSKEPQEIEAPQKTAALSEEEKIVTNAESKYFFSQKDFKETSKSIKSESFEGTLSVAQLKRAYSDLGFPLEELNSPDSVTFKMLNKMKNEKKLLDLRKLVILTIFMGKGLPQDKAEWLFRQYDQDASDVLDPSEFQVMLSDLVDVALRILPILGIGEGVGTLSQEQYDQYVSKLLASRDTVIQELTEQFQALPSMGHEAFVKLLSENKKFSALLSSHQLRELFNKRS